jgi:hypothetical protein
LENRKEIDTQRERDTEKEGNKKEGGGGIVASKKGWKIPVRSSFTFPPTFLVCLQLPVISNLTLFSPCHAS